MSVMIWTWRTTEGKAEGFISLPPRNCAQNAHAREFARASAEKCYRELVAHSAQWLPFYAEHVIIDATFFVAGKGNADGLYRPQDVQNAIGALKAAIDGIVDAGLIPGDSRKHVSWGCVSILPDSLMQKGCGGVYLRLTASKPMEPILPDGFVFRKGVLCLPLE